MKKYIYFLIIGVIGCLIYSCKHNEKDNFSLQENIKTNLKYLKIDTIALPELIYAESFLVYHDSVLIVLNKKHVNGFFIEFYDLIQHKLINKFYRLGNGPNEILSAFVALNDNLLTINDYVKGQVAFLNLDSVLVNPSYISLPIRHFTTSPTVSQYYKTNQLIIENTNCFVDDELKINNNAPRFIVTNKRSAYVERSNFKYSTRNVAADGDIITNYAFNKIIYTYMHKPIIEIYNNDLKLIKRIFGPDKMLTQYRIVDNEIIFNRRIPYTYLDFCTNKDHFFVTYMGDFLVDGKNMEDYPLWIFKFDWNGNFVDSYNIGQYISSISISNDGKSFFGTGINIEKNPILLKLIPR
jgi:hypothetical protein